MRYVLRPLGPWIGPVTASADRSPSYRFKATWKSTLELLGREQYTGWRALPAGSDAATMTADQAARLLAEVSLGRHTAEEILTDPRCREAAYRAAARQAHPDVGADPATFRKIKDARDLLAQVVN